MFINAGVLLIEILLGPIFRALANKGGQVKVGVNLRVEFFYSFIFFVQKNNFLVSGQKSR
jgi:hypothetical protein